MLLKQTVKIIKFIRFYRNVFTFKPKYFLRQNDLRLKSTRPILQEIEPFFIAIYII